MVKILNFQEAVDALTKYIPLSREITGKDITLKRMIPLMAAAGNPHEKLKIVHIAGTSGKTSTTYYITELLVAAGQKVGTTVSPHIDSVAERVQINGVPLSEETFCDALSQFITIVEGVKLDPTYFELLIAFAYWYFDKAGVDYAVIETGLGGLHDSTNVAANPDKVCVITDIGYDHMHVLGKTLASISAQKAGIIHPENAVFMYRQVDEVTDVISEWCTSVGAKLNLLDQAIITTSAQGFAGLNLLPYFQQRNWLLAYEVCKFIAYRDSLPRPTFEAFEHALAVQVPARMDIRKINNKTIIMDGAHNVQKMEAFVSSFQQLFPGKKATVLMSMKAGKEYSDVLPLLLPVANTLIICNFKSVQDTHISAADTDKLAEAAHECGFTNVITERNIDKAYRRLINGDEKLGIITGSFYLIGELRQKYGELKDA